MLNPDLKERTTTQNKGDDLPDTFIEDNLSTADIGKTTYGNICTADILALLYELQLDPGEHRLLADALASRGLPAEMLPLAQFIDNHVLKVVHNAALPKPFQRDLLSIVVLLFRQSLIEGLDAVARGSTISLLEALLSLLVGSECLKPEQCRQFSKLKQMTLLSVHNVTVDLSSVNNRQMADHVIRLLHAEVQRTIETERQMVARLETRILEAETGQLRLENSRGLAARVVNDAMQGKQMPEAFVVFLQGVWFESLVLIATREGVNSEHWQTADQLTRTLIATLDPPRRPRAKSSDSPVFLAAENSGIEKQRNQYFRIVENLSDELRGSLVSLEHDEDAIEDSLLAIEAVHVAIMQGHAVNAIEYQPLTADNQLTGQTRASRTLKRLINRVNEGNWFSIHNEQGAAHHIRLLLKMEKLERLVFTSRAGVKSFEATFAEFAYLLSSGSAYKIPCQGELQRHLLKKLNDSRQQDNQRNDEKSKYAAPANTPEKDDTGVPADMAAFCNAVEELRSLGGTMEENSEDRAKTFHPLQD